MACATEISASTHLNQLGVGSGLTSKIKAHHKSRTSKVLASRRTSSVMNRREEFDGNETLPCRPQLDPTKQTKRPKLLEG